MLAHIFLYLSLGVWGALCVPLPDIVDIDSLMDITEINKDLELSEGDVMENNHRSYISGGQEWTFPIPYQLDADLDMNAKGVILRALEQFRLKTCVDFKPRTNESYYISVEKHSGCWSYVGKQLMKQTLSIGSHCDHITVVEHEFLHALGFLHEQSRYDREDFISINWDNIVEGLGYNFDKYGKEITSNMGTPYDYWSVMHYSQNAFSNKKGPTITTKDARFQDVIGQHLEMSSKDALELNKQYNCNDSISFLDHCSFDEGMCEMSSVGWQRVRQADGGPLSDHTHLGAFMFFSINHNSEGESARLISRKMTPRRSCKIQCLQFFCYHNGTTSDQLNIWIREFDNVSDTEGTCRLMRQVSGSSADYWQLHHVPLNATKTFQVEFEAHKGTGESSGGFSVDDINLSETECPHQTWHIRNFEKALNDSVKIPLLLSPKYYSVDGYRFQIMVKLSDDHFGAFFRLVSGTNDDELQWPCSWRQVTIVALDQNSHIQHRMSAQISLTTDPTQLRRKGAKKSVFFWDNPRHVGSLDGSPERDYVTAGSGYRVFMTHRELRSREFLKGGDLFLLITMQDISSLEHSHALPCPHMPLQTLAPVTQDLHRDVPTGVPNFGPYDRK